MAERPSLLASDLCAGWVHRRDAGQISPNGLAVARGRLEARLDRVLEACYRWPVNESFANRLYRQRNHFLTFLYCPGIEATNWWAQRALRPAVVTRKVWGGNRTVRGAHTQEILASVLQTCGQQNLYSQALLIQLLCFTEPKRLDLMASDLPPPQSSS